VFSSIGKLEVCRSMKIIRFFLFNRLSRRMIEEEFSPENRTPDRLKLFFREFVYFSSCMMTIIILVLAIPTILLEAMFPYITSEYDVLFSLIYVMLSLFLFVVALNKDFFLSQSLVKRYWGYQVVNVKTLKPASQLKCMIRNITIPVFPFEMFFLLINKEKRLGDYIAGTKLVRVEKSDPALLFDEMANYQLDSDSRWALIIPFIIFMPYVLFVLLV
jgi:uncharacterized RDD family membrane protein YckC